MQIEHNDRKVQNRFVINWGKILKKILLIHVGALMQDLKNLLNLNFSKYALTTFILKKLLLSIGY